MMEFKVSKVFTTRGGAHSTTRGTIRLVFLHEGKWLIFHGGPDMYHFSSDGIHWTEQEIKEFAGCRSYLIRGDQIYAYGFPWGDPMPERIGLMICGTIQGNTIEWGKPRSVPKLTLEYYQDLRQDSTGRFTATGRVMRSIVNYDAGKFVLAEDTPSVMTVEWARSLHPNDIMEWEPQQRPIHYAHDGKGSAIHQNIPLENGKSYVIGMLSVNGEPRLYGNLFDGEKWGSYNTLLAENMSFVNGTDKRMSAVWDPKQKTIHLSYVDHDSNLWYRTCPSPYYSEDWSKPIKLKQFKVFTNILSLDTTKTPTEILLLYGKTLFEHPDPRWQSGELYVTKFDGESWNESTLVSEPETKYNWYPNMNEDVSKGIGVMYLKGVPENQRAVKTTDYDIMFSSTRTTC